MSEWQPIETAPIRPFDADKWYMTASERLLLWCKLGPVIGSYSYTRRGIGRWRDDHGKIVPTHWMPLPEAPSPSVVEGGR